MLILLALAVMVTWVVCGAILIGIGSPLLKWVGIDGSMTDAAWAGLVATVGFLIAWNLIFPVDWRATALLAVVSVVGGIGSRRHLGERLRAAWRVGWVERVLSFCAVLGVAVRAAGPCDHMDTFVYGATAVRWVLSYSTVPGLANLHGRLGFNSAVHLCFAALDRGPWRGLAFHLFDGLVVSLLWLSVLPKCVRVVRRAPVSPADWFCAILIIPLFYWTARDYLSGVDTDIPGAAACLMAAMIVFDDGHGPPRRLPLAVWLCALGICCKLSCAVFAGLVGTAGVVTIWRRSEARLRRRWMAGAIVLPAIMLSLWIVRGIVLSGYPFYPLTILPVGVDWRAPEVFGLWDQQYIHSWARTAADHFDQAKGWQWLPIWFHRLVEYRVDFLVAAALMVLSGGILATRRHPPRWTLLICSVAATAFWFWEAPEPRFGEPGVWCCAGVLGAAAIGLLATGLGARRIAMAGLIVLGIVGTRPVRLWNDSYQPLVAVRELEPLAPAQVDRCVLPSGLTVYIPAFGVQVRDGPLPCTMMLNPALRLRREGDLGSGFMTAASQDATWQLKP